MPAAGLRHADDAARTAAARVLADRSRRRLALDAAHDRARHDAHRDRDLAVVDLDGDGHWWIPSGHTFFSPDPITPDPAFARSHFYVPQGAVDPFGNVSRITWDGHHQLLVRSEDALHNVVRAQNDYRVLQPALVTDPNANRQAVAFDALGMVVGTF